MKKTLLILGSLIAAHLSFAQDDHSDITGNVPTAAEDGYAWDFKGSAAANCGADADNNITGQIVVANANAAGATITHGFSLGVMTISQTLATNANIYETANVFNFVEKNTSTGQECSGLTLDLSGTDGDSVSMRIKSSVEGNMQVFICDGSGKCTDNDPYTYTFTADDVANGYIELKWADTDWKYYDAANPGDVVKTQITNVRVRFAEAYNVGLAGTFHIDWMKIGNTKSELPVGLYSAPKATTSFEVFPNPANGDVVNFSKELFNVIVMNSLGSVVFEAASAKELNIVSFESGMYILKSDEGSTKLIVE